MPMSSHRRNWRRHDEALLCTRSPGRQLMDNPTIAPMVHSAIIMRTICSYPLAYVKVAFSPCMNEGTYIAKPQMSNHILGKQSLDQESYRCLRKRIADHEGYPACKDCLDKRWVSICRSSTRRLASSIVFKDNGSLTCPIVYS